MGQCSIALFIVRGFCNKNCAIQFCVLLAYMGLPQNPPGHLLLVRARMLGRNAQSIGCSTTNIQ